MTTLSMDEIIAERKLVVEHSPTESVIVRLGKPQSVYGGAEYRCPYQIVGFGKEVSMFGAGVDSFQSIRIALRMIGVEVRRLNRDNATRLKWPEGTDVPNCGFDDPKPDT